MVIVVEPTLRSSHCKADSLGVIPRPHIRHMWSGGNFAIVCTGGLKLVSFPSHPIATKVRIVMEIVFGRGDIERHKQSTI